MRWVRRLAPWGLAAAVVALLLWRYSPRAIAAEIVDGRLAPMLPWVVLISIGSLALMIVADWLLFSAVLAPLPLGAVARGRAATSILMSLNYGVSSGGYALWLARRTGSRASATVGAVTCQMLCDLGSVLWFALPAAVLGGSLLPDGTRTPTILVAGCGAVLTTALALLGPRMMPARWRSSRFLAGWSRVSAATWAASTALRGLALGVNIFGTWLAARAFGLDLPIEAAVAGLPIVYLVAALPINVLGLGAVQAAWIAVFERHAPGAQILAFQLVFHMAAGVMLVLRGLPFLPGVVRDLDRPPDPAAQ